MGGGCEIVKIVKSEPVLVMCGYLQGMGRGTYFCSNWKGPGRATKFRTVSRPRAITFRPRGLLMSKPCPRLALFKRFLNIFHLYTSIVVVPYTSPYLSLRSHHGWLK